MSDLAEVVERWGQSLCSEVTLGSLISRCSTAHKWKAPYRTLVVREALLWRMYDLGQQILCLRNHEHFLGERILIRAALETFAILVYLNEKIKGVAEGNVPFHDFEQFTMKLLMGSRNDTTRMAAVNVLTALKHADKRHPGVESMHQHFSESAHPNYAGVLSGYSTTDPEEFETRFSNQLGTTFGGENEPAADFLFAAFEYEYNEVWPTFFERLEKWLRENDEQLEGSRIGI